MAEHKQDPISILALEATTPAFAWVEPEEPRFSPMDSLNNKPVRDPPPAED